MPRPGDSCQCGYSFCFNAPATTEIYTLSLHDALPISPSLMQICAQILEKDPPPLRTVNPDVHPGLEALVAQCRSEEHTSELQSRRDLVCRLLLEKKKRNLSRSSGSFFLPCTTLSSASP